MSWTLSPNPQKWRASFANAPTRYVNQRLQSPNTQGILVLDPQYVTGLTEAEGCFSVYFVGNDLDVTCEFNLTLIIDDLPIIEALQYFFKVGSVTVAANKASFSVKRDWQLYYSIIPFFEQHPLLGEKRKSFLQLKEVVRLKVEQKILLSSKHTRADTKMLIATYVYALTVKTGEKGRRKYSLEDIRKILQSKEKNRLVVSPDIPLEYYGNLALWAFTTPLIPFIKPYSWYVTGIFEGDGGCTVSINASKVIHTYNFAASQLEICLMLQRYFGFGKVYSIDLNTPEAKRLPHWRLLINNRQHLLALAYNHFKLYPMFCSKQEHFKAFLFVLEGVARNEHLDPVQRSKLQQAIYSVNAKGKFRRNPIDSK